MGGIYGCLTFSDQHFDCTRLFIRRNSTPVVRIFHEGPPVGPIWQNRLGGCPTKPGFPKLRALLSRINFSDVRFSLYIQSEMTFWVIGDLIFDSEQRLLTLMPHQSWVWITPSTSGVFPVEASRAPGVESGQISRMKFE